MEKVIVAKILKAQGLKGEVKLSATDLENTSLKKGVSVYLKNNHRLIVRSIRERQGFLFVTFENYDSIEAVEVLKNEELYMNSSDLKPLEQNQFYVKDLLNCVVKTTGGKELGKIVEIEHYGANDVYTLLNTKKQEILFALVENLFLEVNLEEKLIIVDEALFDEVKI